MATMLSKLVIGITGDPSGFTKGVDIASAKVTEFSGKTTVAFNKIDTGVKKGFNAQAFAGLENNMALAIGSVTSLGIAFDELGKGTANTSTKLMLAQGLVHSLATGMMVAAKVATGWGAALLGTGIGAVIVGLGWLISKLGETKKAVDKVAKATPAREFLDSMLPASISAPAPSPSIAARLGGGTLSLDRLVGIDSRGARRAAAAEALDDRHAAMVERVREAERLRLETTLATPALGARDAATRFEEMARGVGHTTEELRLMDAVAARSRILAAGGPGVMERTIFDTLTADIGRATAAMLRFDEATRAEGFRTLATRMRDSAATMGMSTEAAELYRLSLVRTFRIVGGVEVAGTRVSTPMEREEEALRGVLANSPKYFAIRARFREEEQLATRISERDRAAARETEHARLLGVGEGLLSQATSAVIGAPSALEQGTVEAASAVNEAIRLAAGNQTTDEQILEVHRRNQEELRRHTATLERIASILGAEQLVENATDIFR